MEKKISKEELSTMIANEIKNKGLNDIVNLEEIKRKVYEKFNQATQEKLEEMGTPVVANAVNQFPNPEEETVSTVNQQPIAQNLQDPISPKIGDTIDPKMAIPFEVPDFLKKIEPWKLIVFDYNELSDGGERLSNKPFRTFENPDNRTTMNNMWSSEGKTKAEVYICKFERIGELDFDYKNGATKFIEKRFEPELTNEKGVYNENPYSSVPKPEVNKEVENYIKNNFNIDQVVTDMISNIIKNYFLTNTERAANENIQESSHNKKSSEVTLQDIIGMDSKYQKVDTPQEIMEAIDKKESPAKLVFENSEIKEWELNGKRYYFLSDPISLNKCYAKIL